MRSQLIIGRFGSSCFSPGLSFESRILILDGFRAGVNEKRLGYKLDAEPPVRAAKLLRSVDIRVKLGFVGKLSTCRQIGKNGPIARAPWHNLYNKRYMRAARLTGF
jgi:hypothetical protein